MNKRKLKVSEEQYFTIKSEHLINYLDKQYNDNSELIHLESTSTIEVFVDMLDYIYSKYFDIETRKQKFETFLSRFTKDQFKKYDFERLKEYSLIHFFEEVYSEQDYFKEEHYVEVMNEYENILR